MPYALCVFFALVASFALATPSAGSSSELIEKIQKKYEETRSLEADFTQKTRSKAASMGTLARGRLFFLKPRAIRWDYEQPRQQFVINQNESTRDIDSRASYCPN